MNLSYDILFTVSFMHNYFNNGKTSAFKAVPAAATANYMRKEGLMYKSQQDSFVVLFDRNHSGGSRSKEKVLTESKSLLFYLVCNDVFLFTYTDLPQEYKPGESCFYFTNQEGNKEGRLHTNDYVSKEDICTNAESIPKETYNHPFGVIRLVMKDIAKDKYCICFTAKTTYWRYLLVSDPVKELQQPAILDKENAVAFTGPLELLLPDKKGALVFTSQSPLALRQQFNRNFRLVENYNAEQGKYKVVMQRLPYPDIRHLSAIGSLSENENYSHYSNIII